MSDSPDLLLPHMNRRQFLRTSALFVGGALITYTLGGCGAEAVPVVAPVAAAVLGAGGRTVGQLLEAFAKYIAAPILTSTVADLLSNGVADLANNARDANNKMQQGGYTQYVTNVYQYVVPSNIITFYCAGPVNGFLGCAPFLRLNGEKALVEGPVITGLSLSAQNWQSTDVPPADGLLIIKALQSTPSDFNKSSPGPYTFQTPAGTLEMQYTSHYPQEQKGLISVVAKKDNGGVLHGEDYWLQWT
jgi:hypothetical protein